MKRCRLLFSACIGTLFYVLVAILGGRDGIWATRQLQEQRRMLSSHLSGIEKTNEELNIQKVTLQEDMDVISAYARKLGYISEGEKLVKVSGLPNRETRIFDPGNVVFHTESKYLPEWLCKAVGLIFFALTYIILVLFDYSKDYSRRQKMRNSRNSAKFKGVEEAAVS